MALEDRGRVGLEMTARGLAQLSPRVFSAPRRPTEATAEAQIASWKESWKRSERPPCPPLPPCSKETEAREGELNGLPKVEERCVTKNQVSGHLLVTLSTYQTKAKRTRPDQTKANQTRPSLDSGSLHLCNPSQSPEGQSCLSQASHEMAEPKVTSGGLTSIIKLIPRDFDRNLLDLGSRRWQV